MTLPSIGFILLSTLIVSSLSGLDVEDYISRGYTCSLAEQTGESWHQPGVERVCDDGVCSLCVKTGDGIKPWLVRSHDMDVEDYLRHGFVCALEFKDLSDSHTVCDDGLCVGCKKPQWSWTGARGEVERFLERGYKCFLVRDIPKYGLAEDVEVVCDDGDCFGCVKTGRSDRRAEELSVEEMLSLGYSCSVTREGAGPGLVCEGGRCYRCSPPAGHQFPVSVRLLDTAEDHLEDGYTCGLTPRSASADSPASEIVLCEADLCLVCWRGDGQYRARSHVRTVTEVTVERAERLAKRGQHCAVLFSSLGSSSTSASSLCDGDLCFICT